MANRGFIVSRNESGETLAAVLRARWRLSWSAVRRLVGEERVRLNGAPCRDLKRRVQTGQRVDIRKAGARPRKEQHQKSTGPGIVIRHVDAAVVVVDKPPGLTTMRHAEEAAEFGLRAQRYLPTTLADLLPTLLAEHGKPKPVRAVHRLDKETSGLVVFARTSAAESHLGRQFRAHTTERRYLAVVRGQARDMRIESFLVRDRGDGRRGSATQRGQGQRAVTHVKVIEKLGDFTLVECRLETGRTHQVRIHLGEAGFPLCGERIYDRPLHGKPVPDASGATRPALHAAFLGFDHPATGQRMNFTSRLPEDLVALIGRWRSRPERET